MYYSSSGSDMHHDHHYYHPYLSCGRGYLPDEFNKENMCTSNGEMKKSQDPEAWFLGIRMFFRWHEYLENMKSKIATFSLKRKAYIWWEYVKNVKGIHKNDLTWHEFERIFKEKYFLRDTLMTKLSSFMCCEWVP